MAGTKAPAHPAAPVARRAAMVIAALLVGLAKVILPIAAARATWWLVEDLVLDRMDLPFV